MLEKILIVDDDKSIAQLLKSFLENEGYQCDAAGDGLEALEFIKNGHQVDLVLLDFVMPRMNGFEFLKVIKV